jgi:regulatory protein
MDGQETQKGGIITAVRAQRRNAERANLYVDGEFRCGIAWDVLLREQLHTGDVITAGTLERIAREDVHWKATQAALSLLNARPRAAGELRDRLRRKGYDDRAIEHAMSEADRLGFIDDAAFAESWVRDRLLLRPRGPRALVAELCRKRVAADVAHAAVARVLGNHTKDEAELCRECADKWLRTHTDRKGDASPDARRRRLAGYLQRRGFSGDAVRAALRQVV